MEPAAERVAHPVSGHSISGADHVEEQAEPVEVETQLPDWKRDLGVEAKELEVRAAVVEGVLLDPDRAGPEAADLPAFAFSVGEGAVEGPPRVRPVERAHQALGPELELLATAADAELHAAEGEPELPEAVLEVRVVEVDGSLSAQEVPTRRERALELGEDPDVRGEMHVGVQPDPRQEECVIVLGHRGSEQEVVPDLDPPPHLSAEAQPEVPLLVQGDVLDRVEKGGRLDAVPQDGPVLLEGEVPERGPPRAGSIGRLGSRGRSGEHRHRQCGRGAKRCHPHQSATYPRASRRARWSVGRVRRTGGRPKRSCESKRFSSDRRVRTTSGSAPARSRVSSGSR